MEETKKKMNETNKGYVPILVGNGEKEEMEKFWVSIKLIHHPKIVELLEEYAKEYPDYKGVLRIKCDVESFKAIIANISNTKPSTCITSRLNCFFWSYLCLLL